MENQPNIHYPVLYNSFLSTEFEDAWHYAMLRYSLQHLTFAGAISLEVIIESLKKSIQVCQMAGINSQHHFKQIYVFNAQTKEVQIDWLMSKNGFNLMIMHIPSLNEKKASWLWELSDL
jgi:hypothetical protein